MISARALTRRPLLAGALLAAGALSALLPGPAHAAPRAAACDPTWCRLVLPTAAELDAIVREADRLLARYAHDETPLGRQCRALGATMRTRAADVRMIAYMWREPDLFGNLAPVTGDAHLAEVVAGTGLVHIARGFDALNPDRGLAAIVQTARHEFAHLNGLAQGEAWQVDQAAAVAAACGQS